MAVGGSGVGAHLIKRILQSWLVHATWPARASIPTRSTLRRVSTCVPLCPISTDTLPPAISLWCRGPDYVHEVAAAGTPFLYFPLKNHFEQNFHVAHPLDRYGAGIRMEFATSTLDAIAPW